MGAPVCDPKVCSVIVADGPDPLAVIDQCSDRVLKDYMEYLVRFGKIVMLHLNADLFFLLTSGEGQCLGRHRCVIVPTCMGSQACERETITGSGYLCFPIHANRFFGWARKMHREHRRRVTALCCIAFHRLGIRDGQHQCTIVVGDRADTTPCL